MTKMSTLLSHLPHLLIQGATFFGIMVSVAKAFEWVDGGLSGESRTKLSLWLKSVPGVEQIDAWASIFPGLIDRVFGKKALSLKFFLRSCIASIAAVAITETLTIALLGKQPSTTNFELIGFKTLAYYLWLAIPINCIPDYFSLLFSRFIVRRMARRPTPVRVFALLMLDSAVSLVIPVASIGMIAPYLKIFGLLGAVEVYAHSVREEIHLFLTTSAMWVHALLQPYYWGPILRLYLFASMFTSVWVWLYVAGSATIRVLHSARSLWARFLPFLSIEDRPMQAIGRVAGVLAALVYVAILIGAWLL